MRIVVTGATGNVGSQLLPQLLSTPEITSVVGLARRLPDAPDPQVEWHAVDVAEDDLRPLLRGADAVVHLAWLLMPAHDPDEMRRVNVQGSRRVFDAAVAEGVPVLVHASSVGTYAPGPNRPPVDESHPHTGISTSVYSRHKAEVEGMLDELEREHPERRVVRLRPGIVFQAQAASALARYFLGPFVPQSLVRRGLLPVVPAVPALAIQAVHAHDVARAYVLALIRPVTGAFNIAAEPVLDPPTLARLLHARTVPLPRAVARAVVDLTWRLHLQPTDPGWVDLGTLGPLMDTTRARRDLGWLPTRDAGEALLETLDAISSGQGGASPVLRPRASGSARMLEVVRALVPGTGGTG
ncbi:MAG TPA: NAD-dependent epimerase/dehydratase family protein [Mycobacteriales bacterium]|nr:NAD-dependent epimerase/dehydratase family protein [Mycobacteriales bacterium]